MKLLSLIALSGLLTLWSGVVVSAATPSFELASSYDIRSDKRFYIQQTFTSSGTSVEPPATSFSVPTVGGDMKNLVARLVDGTALTITGNESQHVVQVDFANIAKKNRNWSFVVTYNSNADSNFGKIEGFSIPSLNLTNLTILKHKVTVSYDPALGIGSVTGPKPISDTLTAGKKILTYESSTGVFAKPIGLYFGDATVANITITRELSNNGWWWKTLEITLPPDTNQQQTMLDSLTPKPHSLRLDEDGNIVAGFRLRPRQKITVNGKVLARLSVPTYSLDGNTSTVADFPDLVKSRYSKLSEGVLATDGPVVTSLRDLYTKNIESTSSDKARELITSLQQKGLAARLIQGVQFLSASQSKLHDWIEAYVPQVGWVTLDPDTGFEFATSDYARLAGRVGEGDFVISTAAIGFDPSSDLPKVSDSPQIVSTNRMLVPGVALGVTTVTMPKGIATDNNAVQYSNGVTTKLGSLAPLQTVSTRRFLLGGKAFSSEEVSYGTDVGGEELANPLKVTSRTSYSYLIYAAIVLLFFITLHVIRNILRKRASHRQPASVDPEMPVLSNIPEQPAAPAPPVALTPTSSPSTAQLPVQSSMAARPTIDVRPRMAYRDPISQQRRRPPTLIQ